MNESSIPKKWMAVAGCVGFGLIILTFGIYAATSSFSWYVRIPFGIGMIGVVAFWIMSVMTSRAMRYGSNVAVMVLLAFCILVLVNFISARNFSRIDTTTRKNFSLSKQTEKILESLDQDINITAFYTEEHYRRWTARNILSKYAQQSDRVNVTFIDPNLKPNMAISYEVEGENGIVVFESGDKRKKVVSFQNEEQDFTGAILKLLTMEQKKLYFLDGHGERDVDAMDDYGYSVLGEVIEAENYEIEKLVLASQPSVPDDCSVLVIAGPQKPLLPQEEESIARYLSEGGKAIIMVDPSPSASLAGLLERWDVQVHDDIILDRFSQSLFQDPTIPATMRYEDHAITNPIARVMTFFPVARSLAPAADLREGLEIVQLVRASNTSWGEVDIEALRSEQRAKYDEGRDFKGPMCMAVAVVMKEKSKDKTPAEPDQPAEEIIDEKRVLVAVGDSNFVTNKHMGAANPDLFMNAVNWLAEEEELISIRPSKDLEQPRIPRLTGRQLRFVTYTSVYAIPILLLIVGGVVWWRRR